MNLKTILKIFKYQAAKYSKLQLITTALAFVFGSVMMYIILSFSDEKDYIYLGTLLAIFASLFCTLILSVKCWLVDFVRVAKMSVGRKNYLIATALVYVVFAVVIAGIIYLLSVIEPEIVKAIYKNGYLDTDYRKISDWLFGNILTLMGLEIGVALVGLFIGALILKFGLAGFWAAYFIFMIGGVVIPSKGDVVAAVLNKVNPALILPSFIVILCLLCAGSTTVYLKTEL
jgi:hypothetical protein